MRSNRHPSNRNLRREISELAARFLVEDGVESMGQAKRKAATTLGVEGSRNMPENLEVQAAVIEYQKLFEGDVAVQRIARMRAAALGAMRQFRSFSPRLVGPVLYGSACAHDPIGLHLFSEEVEGVTRFLHEHRIDYYLDEIRLTRRRHETAKFPVFYLANNHGDDFELVVMPLVFLANPPISALDGRPFRRLDEQGLSELVKESDMDRFGHPPSLSQNNN